MSKLEPFYLSSVLLYITHRSVLTTFQAVNKKCNDAIQMLRINPPLFFFRLPFIFNFFPNLSTLRGNLIEFQNSISKEQLTQISWIESTVIIPFNLINTSLYNKITEIRLSPVCALECYKLMNLRRLFIFCEAENTLLLTKLPQHSVLKRIGIYHESPLTEFESNNFIQNAKRLLNVEFVLNTKSNCKHLVFLKNVTTINNFEPTINTDRQCESPVTKVDLHLDVLDEYSAKYFISPGVIRMTVDITRNCLDYLNISSFVLKELKISVKTGRHWCLCLPSSLVVLTIKGGTFWLTNLKRLDRLKDVDLDTELTPPKAQKGVKSVCLPLSVENCCIKSIFGNSKFGNVDQNLVLRKCNVTGCVDFLDCSKCSLLTHLTVYTTAQQFTLTVPKLIKNVSVISKNGRIVMKNSRILNTMSVLHVEGNFEFLDLTNLYSVESLVLISSAKATQIKFPKYPKNLVECYFHRPLDAVVESLINSRSLSLKGNFNVKKLWISMSSSESPVIEIPHLKEIVLFYTLFECIGYDSINNRCKFMSTEDKCCFTIPITLNITQHTLIKISVVSKTKWFTISNPTSPVVKHTTHLRNNRN
ncbi:hypothetical protein EIN_429500, partial [Entamoeba invadens IP1]